MTKPDSQLLEQANQHDPRALAEIYDRYAESIYRYLFRYVGDAEQAEDLTSEVFLTLVRVAGTSKAPRDHLRGWLYRVAHNRATDSFRWQTKNATLSLDEQPYLESDLASLSDKDLPTAALEKRQSQQQLRMAIRQLTPDQQRVILLRFGESLKVKEVGQLMGKSEAAIKVLQYRAIRRLRKLLRGRRNEVYEETKT